MSVLQDSILLRHVIMLSQVLHAVKYLPNLAKSCQDSPLQLQESKVEQLKDIARQCGASIVASEQQGSANDVTHVVALTSDSEQAAWAWRTQRSVVRPAWLLCCAHTWYKAREDGLSLQPQQ